MKSFGGDFFRHGHKLVAAAGEGEQVRDRNLNIFGEADEVFDRDAVASVFVFLELLEGDADMVGDFGLCFAGGNAGRADGASQIAVEGAFGLLFGSSGHGR